MPLKELEAAAEEPEDAEETPDHPDSGKLVGFSCTGDNTPLRTIGVK